jgi:DNA repair photolyase
MEAAVEAHLPNPGTSRLRPKGRAALSNASGRFEPLVCEIFDDGWETGDTPPPPLITRVTAETCRRAITRNSSPDIPFERSVNPYRGCEHGCIYCYARPTHAWLGLSPGLDFESRLFAKPDAPERLRREFSAPSYRCAPLALGVNTDAYQPIERKFTITRQILELCDEFSHPVSVITKSALVLRDIDVLTRLSSRNLVRVYLSLTTLDKALSRAMEPRAATPLRRLAAIAELSKAGVRTGVSVAPVIPRLNDHEIEHLLKAARDAGAETASYTLLRLPFELKGLFAEWLEANFPDRARHVLSLIRQTRGGALNESDFKTRMKGSGEYARLIGRRFDRASRRLGLTPHDWDMDTQLFAPPPQPGDQLSLF